STLYTLFTYTTLFRSHWLKWRLCAIFYHHLDICIPVISKLPELVILEICEPCLQSDDLQFGFEPGLGCVNAIFVLNETVQYFNSDRKSTRLNSSHQII